MTKVAIIGGGYVGQAMNVFFQKKYNTVIFDTDTSKRKGFMPFVKNDDKCKDWVNKHDLGVVCVPTPTLKSGGCDTSIVESVVDWLDTPLILIKSTVSVGTTDRLKKKTGKRIVFSPEYCGEGKYFAGNDFDFQNNVLHEPFYTFGGDPEDTAPIVDLFTQIAGPTKQYFRIPAIDAEMAKYMENTFLMMKVVYCYEMFNICQATGANWHNAREAWLLDPRMGKSHSAVFPENNIPAASPCIPKDIIALINTAEKAGYSPDFVKELVASNRRMGVARGATEKELESINKA